MTFTAGTSRRLRSAVRGLSLPEVMISLVIMSMLLTAIATAFSGSSQAIEMNDSFFRSTQAARVTIDQMTAEIRNCDQMSITGTTVITIYRPSSSSGSQFAAQTNELYRTFTYDSVNRRITMQITYSGGTTGTLYELASNVISCTFGPVIAGTNYNNVSMPVRVPITLQVGIGTGITATSVTLNGCAAPRRAMQY